MLLSLENTDCGLQQPKWSVSIRLKVESHTTQERQTISGSRFSLTLARARKLRQALLHTGGRALAMSVMTTPPCGGFWDLEYIEWSMIKNENCPGYCHGFP